jgi:hypothetical protein
MALAERGSYSAVLGLALVMVALPILLAGLLV